MNIPSDVLPSMQEQAAGMNGEVAEPADLSENPKSKTWG
jgi:hypothetical protein